MSGKKYYILLIILSGISISLPVAFPIFSVGAMGVNAYLFNIFSVSFGVGAAGFNIVEGLYFPILGLLIPIAIIILMILMMRDPDERKIRTTLFLSIADAAVWVLTAVLFLISISNFGLEGNLEFWFFAELIVVSGLIVLSVMSSKADFDTDDYDYYHDYNTQQGNSSRTVCGRCGAVIFDNDAVFCPECGADLNKRKCRKCGHLLDDDEMYCPECGTRDVDSSVCVNCGQKLKNGAKFCGKCGAKI